nr:hypothetical protein 1 - date palm mitochondrion plasmid S [Phoenix dactylifera]
MTQRGGVPTRSTDTGSIRIQQNTVWNPNLANLGSGNFKDFLGREGFPSPEPPPLPIFYRRFLPPFGLRPRPPQGESSYTLKSGFPDFQL